MTLLAILTAAGLILNVLLAIAVVRGVSDIQKRIDTREELDGIWRDALMERVRRLEGRAKHISDGQARPAPKRAPERRSGHGK